MNTEPPEGDDLQRMLVAMKQNVLERATPRRRRRARPGLVIGVVGLLALGTASGAVALSLSQQDRPVAAPAVTQEPEPAPSATTPTSAPITATPTPRPVPTQTPTATPTSGAGAVRVPGSCYLLVPNDDYLRLFGAAKLSEYVVAGPGRVRATEPEDRLQGLRDPKESLECRWQNEGVAAGITVWIMPAGSEAMQGTVEVINESNPVCVDRLGGRACTYTPGTDSGDAIAGTLFTRGNLTIDIMQTDFPTNGLLPAIVGEIWGD